MADRVSQAVVEAEVVADPEARVSQGVVEAEIVSTPRLRVSQEVVEGQVVTNRASRVSQYVIECLVPRIGVFMPLVYPTFPGLQFSTFWKPSFNNMPTQKMASGAELDLGITAEPLHTFELSYEFLRDRGFAEGSTEFRTFIGFFGALGGNLGRYVFKNVDDNAVQQQFVGTTDGTAHTWTLSRTFGIGEYVWTETVGYVDLTLPFNVYLDGNLQDPTSYSVARTQPKVQQLVFNATPAAGKRITVDMSYLYYCKFPDPSMNFEKFMKALWAVKKVSLQSCRAGTGANF